MKNRPYCILNDQKSPKYEGFRGGFGVGLLYNLSNTLFKHCLHVCCSVVTHGISAQHSEHFTLTRGTIQAASKVPLSTPHRHQPSPCSADCGLQFLIIFSLQQRAKCILNIRADVSPHEPFGQIRGKRCLIL